MALKVGELSIELGVDDKSGPALAQAESRLGRTSGLVDGLKRSMANLGIGAMGAEITRVSTEFNAGMANVASLIPGNRARVRELTGEVQKLRIALGVTGADATAGLYQTISAFGDTADTMKIMETNAKDAKAGVATLTDSINLTSAVTKAYGDTSAQAVEHAADLGLMTVRLGQTTFPELAGSIGKVTPLTKALNISQEELFATMATLTGVTGSAGEVSSQYRGVLQSLMAPTADMSKLMQSLGYANGEAMVKALGQQGAIKAIVEAAKNSGQPLQNYISSIEGQVAALALAGAQSGDYEKKLGEMGKAAGATKAAFNEQANGVNWLGQRLAQAGELGKVAMEKIGIVGPLLTAGAAIMQVVETLNLMKLSRLASAAAITTETAALGANTEAQLANGQAGAGAAGRGMLGRVGGVIGTGMGRIGAGGATIGGAATALGSTAGLSGVGATVAGAGVFAALAASVVFLGYSIKKNIADPAITTGNALKDLGKAHQAEAAELAKSRNSIGEWAKTVGTMMIPLVGPVLAIRNKLLRDAKDVEKLAALSDPKAVETSKNATASKSSLENEFGAGSFSAIHGYARTHQMTKAQVADALRSGELTLQGGKIANPGSAKEMTAADIAPGSVKTKEQQEKEAAALAKLKADLGMESQLRAISITEQKSKVSMAQGRMGRTTDLTGFARGQGEAAQESENLRYLKEQDALAKRYGDQLLKATEDQRAGIENAYKVEQEQIESTHRLKLAKIDEQTTAALESAQKAEEAQKQAAQVAGQSWMDRLRAGFNSLWSNLDVAKGAEMVFQQIEQLRANGGMQGAALPGNMQALLAGGGGGFAGGALNVKVDVGVDPKTGNLQTYVRNQYNANLNQQDRNDRAGV